MNDIKKAVTFLEGIGIPMVLRDSIEKSLCFVPNVRIEKGEVHYTNNVHIGDLLHESAHVAIFPKRFRPLLTGNLYQGFQKAWDLASNDTQFEVDSPLYRALIQASDPEATAWSYAAGISLGFTPEEIIRDDRYDGDASNIRSMLSHRRYAGINGLSHAGFCATSQRTSAYTGLECYPSLSKWTQDA